MTNDSDTKILNGLLMKLDKMLPKGLTIGLNVSGHNTLELCRMNNNSVESCRLLAVGNKRQIINMIDFYFNFQSVIEMGDKA